MKRKSKYLLLAVWLMCIAIQGFAQERNAAFYDYAHNHLDWYTIESDHFMVHFQDGNSRPAQVISRIAEEVYGPVTTFYELEPDTKVNIVLIDRLDYANGAAYFFDNKIEIWLPALDSPLRGTHNWLRNVITHEFVHIVQIQASMKRNRQWPASYLQWLSYEEVRRPDVLYGYPTGIITFPLAHISMPAWLAEGTAQFMRDSLYYDYWDSHRDMILRTRILDGSYQSLEQMGTFSSKTSIEREVTYNQGFAFTYWLSHTYGEQILADISRAIQERGVYDIRKAIKIATGKDGRDVFEEWISWMESFYHGQMQEIDIIPTEMVQEEGFLNFDPKISGNSLAYISNRGRDGSRLSIYLKDLESGELSRIFTDPAVSAGHGFTLSCGLELKPEVNMMGSSYDLSADGKNIVYNRLRENKFGELYSDLYIHTIGEKKSTKRLTVNGRVHDPAWSVDGERLISVVFRDGSLNLALVERGVDTLRAITTFRGGEQVYSPVWHPDGRTIVFSFSNHNHRELRRIDVETGQMSVVKAAPGTDFRDPSFSIDGDFLYYVSDASGIFNVYGMEWGAGGVSHQITSVVGGAFQPAEAPDGSIYFSEYKSDGYVIARTRKTQFAAIFDVMEHQTTDSPTDTIPIGGLNPFSDRTSKPYNRPFTPDSVVQTGYTDYPLNEFDDTDITSLPDDWFGKRRLESQSFTIGTKETQERTFYPYTDQYTSFAFYPAVRFDNYSKVRGSNSDLLRRGEIGDLSHNLWRDVKIGTYFASREILDRFSIFGGALFGFGSREANSLSEFIQPGRIVDLDRDLFLIAEYRGLPFIKRSWSPTVSIELYNLRRNVENGISIEEFPCTACLPDTTGIGVAYDIWQAQVSFISKLNRFMVAEVGIMHSPYRVSIESFISKEYKQSIPGSSSRYFIGNTYTMALFLNAEVPYRHSDVAPVGTRAFVRYNFQPSRLLDGYDIRGGSLVPRYNNFKVHSLELDARYGFRLANQHFRARSRLYSNLRGTDEYFFLDYIGGFTGMRSYPFFALGGNTTWFGQLSYTIPLVTNIAKQQGRFTMDKIFTRFFVETGNGWGGPLDVGSNLKSGAGAELRFSLNSYYLFPTRFFISGSYGFDRFDVRLPDSFITTTGKNTVSYGGELLFNFGILFDFDF